MTDPIADMLTRIRNAMAVKKKEIVLPLSKLKLNVAKILEKEGWVEKVETIADSEKNNFHSLKIVLKYRENGKPAITSIRRLSRPGLRLYSKKTELPRVLNNKGIAIVTTSQGIMTNREAKKRGIGGELLCEIY